MNEPEQHENAVRDVLHHTVDHIHASPDLAQRVERVAGRRRTARWSAIGATALIAVGTTGILATAHTAASPTYSTSQTRLPSCAANMSAYQQRPGVVTPLRAPTVPVVPGSPVSAAVCRYGDNGDLAGSAKVTEQAQLAQLQTAMNASKAFAGAVSCMAFYGEAIVIFTYPQGTADLTVTYIPTCVSLHTKAGSYLVNGDVDQLITDWTGSWWAEASPSSG